MSEQEGDRWCRTDVSLESSSVNSAKHNLASQLLAKKCEKGSKLGTKTGLSKKPLFLPKPKPGFYFREMGQDSPGPTTNDTDRQAVAVTSKGLKKTM